MAKILNKYHELKNLDKDKIYIFESGVFLLVFNEDAELVSNLMNLKLVGLSEVDCKCGFPIKSQEKYLNILDGKNIKYEIIKSDKKIKENIVNKDIGKEIIRKLKSINVEYYTPIEALNFLKELKEIIK